MAELAYGLLFPCRSVLLDFSSLPSRLCKPGKLLDISHFQNNADAYCAVMICHCATFRQVAVCVLVSMFSAFPIFCFSFLGCWIHHGRLKCRNFEQLCTSYFCLPEACRLDLCFYSFYALIPRSLIFQSNSNLFPEKIIA